LSIGTLMHGWTGLGVGLVAVQLPMYVAMVKQRAALPQYLAAPVLGVAVAAGVTGAMALASECIPGLSSTPVLQVAVGLAASAVAGYSVGRAWARTREFAAAHRRGTLIGEGRRKDPSESALTHELTLAGVSIARGDEAKHFKLIGTTGTGKSTAISELLRGALRRGDRAVIADPDGGYLKSHYVAERGDLILNPFDPRSARWNPFAEIDSPYDVDQLARALIPDQEGSDRSWRGYGRTFLGAVLRQCHEAGIHDTAELYRLLVTADAGELRVLVKGTPAQPFLDEHNARMFDSIRSVTASAVGALEYIASGRGQSLSIRNWVRSPQAGSLFIPYRAGQIAALGTAISAWMRLAIFETMNRDGISESGQGPHRPLWFIVDEIDALGPIDGLKDALARLRKFEGRCVLGFQSIAQVSSTYGRGDAQTVVENCANSLILRCSASEGGGTARFASQLIGEREVMRVNHSTSRRVDEFHGSITRSSQIALEPAVLPAQIEQLPDLTGYLKRASDPVWRRVSLARTAQMNPAANPVATPRSRDSTLVAAETGLGRGDE
jgi:type IV secretory pathway TraG/TraD family ATPase VirD4